MAMEVGATAILLALLALALLLIVKQYRKEEVVLVIKAPHPPTWPIIGHLHLLREKRPIHRIISSLSDTYGPIIHLQLGCRSLLLISSSDLAKQCFTTNDKAFASRPRLCAGKYLGYNYKDFVSAPYSSYWRNLRKMCALHIFSATRIESLKHVRVEEVSDLIRSLFEWWQAQREAEAATPVNMKSRLSDLTFNIILRTVANRRLSEEFQEAHQFKEMIEEAFLLLGAFEVGDFLPFLKCLDLQGLKSAMKKLHKKRDVFLQKLLIDHREKQGFQPKDFIDVLISATDKHEIESDSNDDVVKATALSIINAATDTTAVTMEWALAALLQHPHILNKAQQELDTHIGRERVMEEADVRELKYLQAIVKETLRLYPAAPLLLPHEAIEDCSVGGYHVSAGTRLLVNAWAIHRDPAVWERPAEFEPERFFKNGSSGEIDVKGQDFELIPFGSGRRMCAGMSLALNVVTYTLGRLLQSFDWSLPEGTTIDMTEGFGLTMPKRIPLEAIIKPRLPFHLY